MTHTVWVPCLSFCESLVDFTNKIIIYIHIHVLTVVGFDAEWISHGVLHISELWSDNHDTFPFYQVWFAYFFYIVFSQIPFLKKDYLKWKVSFYARARGSRHQGEYILVVVVVIVLFFFCHLLKLRRINESCNLMKNLVYMWN